MRTRSLFATLLAASIAVSTAAVGDKAWSDDDERDRGRGYQNVIVLVPDGTAQTVATLARWWNDEPLNVDGDFAGAVRTYMSNSVITGSAAAATAFATGYKTTVRFIGVGPRPDDVLSTEETPPEWIQYRPLATVLEAAKDKGKATGLISTSRITHATPASYAAHIHDRGMDNEIMEHLVYQDVDLVFGGGKRHLLPEDEGGRRTDGENLIDELLSRGYEFVETKDEMDDADGPKVWGMFASSHMEADVDRDEFAPEQPSLAEMTRKALELLSEDEDGLFLMIEGSQVDWAGHANDPYYMMTDFLAFDEAYGVAVEFAEENGDTLVIAFPDHNTGGMTIGHYETRVPYTATTVADLLGPLVTMDTTSTGITSTGLERMIDADVRDGLALPQAIAENLDEWWGIPGLNQPLCSDEQETDDLVDEILALEPEVGLAYAIAEVISRNCTVFGWTTNGHTGEDVPLWVHDADEAYGVIENTELAEIVAEAMKANLDRLNQKLYVDAKEAFPEAGLDMSDPTNPVLVIGRARLPVSKDLVEIDGRTHRLEGIVVHAPLAPTANPLPETSTTGKVYIPEEAVRIINRGSRGRRN
jgi:alkaline phosphatase